MNVLRAAVEATGGGKDSAGGGVRRTLCFRFHSAERADGIPGRQGCGFTTARNEERPGTPGRDNRYEAAGTDRVLHHQKDAVLHGYTRGCLGCGIWLRGVGEQPHTAEFRERFRKLMSDGARVQLASQKRQRFADEGEERKRRKGGGKGN